MNKEICKKKIASMSDALLFFLEKHYWSATVIFALFWLIIGIVFPPPLPEGGIGGCF